MILSKEDYRKIEYYFINFKDVEFFLNESREDIIHAAPKRDLSGISVKTPGDPTFDRACRLHELDLGRWVKVVRATFGKFSGTPIGTLMGMRYLENASWQKICMELFIEKRTYHTWVNEVIMYAALKACEEGVLKIN